MGTRGSFPENKAAEA